MAIHIISGTPTVGENTPEKREVAREETGEKEKAEEELREFPDIPIDIARLIFEKAMEDTPTPVSLALVSRQVQQWVEPLIYRNLTFLKATNFNLFYRTFRNRRYSPSKSTSFFAKHVKSLHILTRAAPRMEQVIAIGRVLKSLRAVAGWDNSWGCFMLGFLVFNHTGEHGKRVTDLSGPRVNNRVEREREREEAERKRREGRDVRLFRGWVEEEDGLQEEQDVEEGPVFKAGKEEESEEDAFSYKDLRRLSISAHSLRIFHIDFTIRVFRDVTHLDIYYCRVYDWSTLTTMKNLTHLAIDFLTLVNLNFIEMRQCMEDVIGYCQDLPRLKAIIFACVNWWSRDFDLLDDEHNVLSPLNFSSEDWQKGGPLITTTIDEHQLHYFTQLSLGMHDPRIVLGVVSECLQKSHLMREYMVDFVWPKNSYDWDFTVPKERHKESWEVAEEIIERRKRERAERRMKIGMAVAHNSFGNENAHMDGEFGFGEIVNRRWRESLVSRGVMS